MPSQKIPLFGGVIKPLPDAAGVLSVFSPPDKNLAAGTQATYEVHLWAVLQQSGSAEVLQVSAAYNSDLSAVFSLAVLDASILNARGIPYGTPVKVLDGYPVRGNVTIQALCQNAASNPNGPQLFGYYYRVGQGPQNQPERRFIGVAPLDDGDFSTGIPFTLLDGATLNVHDFVQDRIDEISLAFINSIPGDGGTVSVVFLDKNNNVLPGTGQTLIALGDALNSDRDPQSMYTFCQIPFGGNSALQPLLDHMSITWTAGEGQALFVHGYFTRH